MQCHRCQHENPVDTNFCGQCGAQLAVLCAACRAANPPTNKFCGKCGAPLVQGAPAARFSSPERYTPSHLAEKILTSKTALEGERKQVTVLFADLKGSMELLADRDPEEARKILDPVLERMMDAVHHYEGTVNQVMGDGIMALFGAPLAHEDHAVRACYAALAMQESVRRYGDEVQRSGAIPPQVRVGLNSGEVVVRSVGNDLRMDYTAVGQTTHLAARMEQLAKAGSVLITGATLKLAEGHVQVKPLGSVPVKGLTDPIEAYEVTGAVPVRTRFQAAAARGLTRFVGRQTELDMLIQALRRAGAGHGEVVALVGEPGVGKSRLVWEFTHSHHPQGWLVLESGSVSYGKATAYRPVIDLLKAYCQIEDRDDARKVREKVTGKILALDRALEATLPALLTLLDIPVEDPGWHALDPPQRRQRTLEALKRLVLRESRAQPLLLVFEDLHWIDHETQAFLDGVVESLPTARLLLLVNYRPEYQQGWAHKTYFSQLRIDPLPPGSAEDLLRALFGDSPELHPLKRLLIERTEGNPFFLEESVRTLVETHALVGERGGYRLARALREIHVAPTIQTVLAARMDRLPPDDKRLLQTAAVIGKDVPFALLQAIAEMPEEALRRGLTHLRAAEFLYEASLFPDLEYTFKHALTHEVAYATLLQERRRLLHARIVQAMETLYAERLAEHVERLGHHAFRGEAWEKAATYLRQAGTKAFARAANREAVACFEQALEALQHLPESRSTLEEAIDLRFDLRNSLIPLGEIGPLRHYLRELETLVGRLDDQRRAGFLSAYMASFLFLTGDGGRAVEWGHRALTVADALGDFTLQVTTAYRLGQAYHFLGDYPRALDFLRRNVASLQGEHLVSERFGEAGLPSVMSRVWLAFSLAERGEFAEGIPRAEEGLRIATATDQPFSLVAASLGAGTLYVRKGDLQNAIRVLEPGLRLCEAWNTLTYWPGIAAHLGLAYALSGRIAEALPLLERALERANSMRLGTSYAIWAAYLAEGRRLAARLDDALEAARRALEFARERKARGQEAWALRVVGEIASHREPPAVEVARDYFRQALTLATELGMRPLVAHCHLGLGKLYRRTGKRQETREHLGTAITMYHDMDMRFWLEQAEAELAESARS